MTAIGCSAALAVRRHACRDGEKLYKLRGAVKPGSGDDLESRCHWGDGDPLTHTAGCPRRALIASIHRMWRQGSARNGETRVISENLRFPSVFPDALGFNRNSGLQTRAKTGAIGELNMDFGAIKEECRTDVRVAMVDAPQRH